MLVSRESLCCYPNVIRHLDYLQLKIFKDHHSAKQIPQFKVNIFTNVLFNYKKINTDCVFILAGSWLLPQAFSRVRRSHVTLTALLGWLSFTLCSLCSQICDVNSTHPRF